MSKSLLAALTLAAAVSAMSLPAAPPALACGDSEAGGCGENGAADDARWLLKRAVAAVKANEAKALTEFSNYAERRRYAESERRRYVFSFPDEVFGSAERLKRSA